MLWSKSLLANSRQKRTESRVVKRGSSWHHVPVHFSRWIRPSEPLCSQGYQTRKFSSQAFKDRWTIIGYLDKARRFRSRKRNARLQKPTYRIRFNSMVQGAWVAAYDWRLHSQYRCFCAWLHYGWVVSTKTAFPGSHRVRVAHDNHIRTWYAFNTRVAWRTQDCQSKRHFITLNIE